MKIVEHSPTRLILRQQQALLAAFFALFALVCLVMLVALFLQGITRLGLMNLFQVIGWLAWLGVAGVLVALGLLAWAGAQRGTRCTFDKQAGTFVLERAGGLRPSIRHGSLYSIAQLDVEHNAEVRQAGLFLRLRSGERLPLLTVPAHDETHLRGLLSTVRTFLWQPG
ncbi:MAG: hypothetical protein MUE40_09585 [Anaerolineae bacterium]|jgi:hypothetical protein|nr:hypothetical protein [Anaerolineae bacterium]